MTDLAGQIADLHHRIAEIERRDRNRQRTGKIKELDLSKGLARVEFKDEDGRPYTGPWMPWKEVAAGGIKTHFPPTIDEQVDVVSESGDLGDGVIDMSTPSDQNPRPHNGPEAVIVKGSSRIFVSDTAVIITADKIVLKGEVHLGDEGGKLVHRKGDLDSDGDAAVESAVKVFAV